MGIALFLLLVLRQADDVQLDQYMVISKKDLMINITLNELYNTHTLLSQHVDMLVSTPHHHSDP